MSENVAEMEELAMVLSGEGGEVEVGQGLGGVAKSSQAPARPVAERWGGGCTPRRRGKGHDAVEAAVQRCCSSEVEEEQVGGDGGGKQGEVRRWHPL